MRTPYHADEILCDTVTSAFMPGCVSARYNARVQDRPFAGVVLIKNEHMMHDTE